MANFLYTNIKRLLLTGQFDWTTDNVVAILIATGQYEPSINHATLLDIPAAARVAVSGILTGKTVSVNVVDADDYLYTTVSGPPVNAVILAVSNVSEATSPLICYLDDAVLGLPITPSAGPIQLTWSNGAAKVFAL